MANSSWSVDYTKKAYGKLFLHTPLAIRYKQAKLF